ncbi:light-harvesting protein [Aestuariivirga sp.]|uniref:light-harvesting protein n=1 Tax=Aestuariivirga sp. TaxID=2650926 RepID=UPI0035949068
MNQGRIWCVVSPTVGLPLFIGGVAVTSLVVHASVLTNVSWMGKYWEGANAKMAMTETISPVASNIVKTDQGYVITVTVAPDTATKLSSNEGGTLTVAAAAE